MGSGKPVVLADISSWPIQQGDEPAGEQPAVLASPEVCLGLRPEQARSLRVDFAGPCSQTVALEPDLSASSQWPRRSKLKAVVTRQAGMWVLGIVTSDAPHTKRWSLTLPSPWPVICIGQWPGHRAHRGEVGKRTLASSIMSAKRAELKKTNLVKERELGHVGLLSPHWTEMGWAGYRDRPDESLASLSLF